LTEINGQTTVSYAVTNKCKNTAHYVAIGTHPFTRLLPTDGAVYAGNLGTYDVTWTKENGSPGFVGIKFDPASKNLNNGASDVFRVVVSNFDPNTTIQVEAFNGPARERFSFLLSQITCLPTSVPGLSKWLSGSWNRLLGWLSPQTSVNMSAVERENKSRNAEAAIDFKRENNNLLAISPDGTLNWHWISQGPRASN
jgi:hypothetical protein